MTTAQYHLQEQEIPEGMQIFEERIEVAGVSHRRQDAVSFAKAKNIWLEFERDQENQYDKNAIKMIGCSKGFFGTKRRFIGYVPKDFATNIVENDFLSQTKPRLLKTYIGDNGYVEILFQLLGSKGKKSEYTSKKSYEYEDSAQYIDRVKQLKNEKNYSEAIELLLKLVNDTKQDAKAKGPGWGVSPWYYEQLAILYRKEKRYNDEVAILEQYENQPKAPGVSQQKLADRLLKARELRDRKNA